MSTESGVLNSDTASRDVVANQPSAAEILPSRYGLKGTVVPKTTSLGGQVGRDLTAKPVVFLDPDLNTGRSIDLSKITAEDIAALHRASDRGEDPATVAAKVAYRLSDLSEGRAPTTKPSAAKGQTVTSHAEVLPEHTATAEAKPVAPSRKAVVELGKLAQIETWYHHIIQDGYFLILVYDHSYPTGTIFMPQQTEVPVYVHDISAKKVFRTQSAGIRFRIASLDVCVLLVEETVSEDESESDGGRS